MSVARRPVLLASTLGTVLTLAAIGWFPSEHWKPFFCSGVFASLSVCHKRVQKSHWCCYLKRITSIPQQKIQCQVILFKNDALFMLVFLGVLGPFPSRTPDLPKRHSYSHCKCSSTAWLSATAPCRLQHPENQASSLLRPLPREEARIWCSAHRADLYLHERLLTAAITVGSFLLLS